MQFLFLVWLLSFAWYIECVDSYMCIGLKQIGGKTIVLLYTQIIFEKGSENVLTLVNTLDDYKKRENLEYAYMLI